jgi:hypothetical protein
MSVVSIRSEGVTEYLARTCTDWSVEAVPERDPEYQLPRCDASSVTEPVERLADILAVRRLLRVAKRYQLI